MSAQGESTKPSVYIVDDDNNVLRSLRVVLMRHYAVQTCDNPEQAVSEIKAQRPDVVVVDLKMPEHDGFWVFREVRKFDAEVPIVFNSAYQDVVAPEDVAGAYAPFAYLTKTGNLAEFHDVMQRAAAHARHRRLKPSS